MKFNYNISGFNNFNNNDIVPLQQKKEEIFITFTFKKYNKQIFIDIDPNISFENCINELCDKYHWLKFPNNKTYTVGNKLIGTDDCSKTLKDLNIKNDTDIIIILDDKVDERVNTNNVSQNSLDKITVDFKIRRNSSDNTDDCIDIPNCSFKKNSTVKQVLSCLIFDENSLASALDNNKFCFGSKGKNKQKDDKGEFVDCKANLILIKQSDLNKTMDGYIGRIFKKTHRIIIQILRFGM